MDLRIVHVLLTDMDKNVIYDGNIGNSNHKALHGF